MHLTITSVKPPLIMWILCIHRQYTVVCILYIHCTIKLYRPTYVYTAHIHNTCAIVIVYYNMQLLWLVQILCIVKKVPHVTFCR